MLSHIDPERKLIKYRRFRDSCNLARDCYVKDLNILGRDLNKTIIVDNTLSAFAYQVDNGVLIKSYFGDKQDTALIHLLPELLNMRHAEDVRLALMHKMED